MNKKGWLDAAEVFDAWRVVPRALILGFATWIVYVFDLLIRWYIGIPTGAANILGVQSAFVFGVFSALSTLSGYIFKVYSDGGRDWQEDRAAETTSSTVVATSTVSK